MAGDWIKWVKGLPDKPEVVHLASVLTVTQETAACKLMRFWEWCDEQVPSEAVRADGSAVIAVSPSRGDTVAFLDRLVTLPGFAEALVGVRWLALEGGAVVVPNYDRHNGATAKTRSRNSRNQRHKRSLASGGPGHGATDRVTGVSPAGGDETVTREEKRRVNTPLPPKGGKGSRRKPAKPAADRAEDVPIPASLDCPAFRAVWFEEWLPGRADKQGKAIRTTARAAQLQLAKLAGYPVPKAVETLRTALMNQWVGIHPGGDAAASPPVPPSRPATPEGLDSIDQPAGPLAGIIPAEPGEDGHEG